MRPLDEIIEARMTVAQLPAPAEVPDPRDEFLARVVAGRSFADVGGLWGVVNEKVSVAARLGAAEVTMIDITEDGPTSLWRQFEQRMSELGVAHYRSIQGDVCVLQLDCFDVVHCSGVLYHHPNPLVVLSALARLTRQWLVLMSATLPRRIENAAGVVEIPAASAVFVPALADRERRVLAEHWRLNGARAWGLHQAVSFSLEDFAPWWWIPTDEALRAMVAVCGLAVRDSSPSWNGYARTYLLEKEDQAARTYLLDKQAQAAGDRAPTAT